MVFSVAALIFACWTFRSRAFVFAIALVVGAAPGVAWNVYFFHSLMGGYITIRDPYIFFSPSYSLMALAGLLVSPSRGLLTFSPVLVFSIVGAVQAWRVRDRDARLVLLLAAASAALILQYAVYRYWFAGYCYGPRFLTDLVAVAALLLVYVIPTRPLTYLRTSASSAITAGAFVLLFIFSVAVQFVGVNSGASGSEWNAVPIDVVRDPHRVWPITDNQIQRNVRAAYYRFFAWDIAATPDYDQGAAARVTAISPSFARVSSGAAIDATAALSNDGRSTLFGYDSGVYVGQLRLLVRITDAKSQTYPNQYLYMRGSPASGEQADALGTLIMPRAAGTYLLECDPVLVGGGAVSNHGAPFRVVVQVN
jgi:hypothetical protein